MPDSSGFGDYTGSGVVIPCTCTGEPCNFVAQMYLDDATDTLTGTLHYAGQMVAMGTMACKHESLARDPARTMAALTKVQVNLKLIPDVDGRPKIAQLVRYALTEVTVKGSWVGPARLHLIPHVNAPVADLPIRRVVGGRHFVADLTLPYGSVLHDYLA